jgi:hypothetical protein
MEYSNFSLDDSDLEISDRNPILAPEGAFRYRVAANEKGPPTANAVDILPLASIEKLIIASKIADLPELHGPTKTVIGFRLMDVWRCERKFVINSFSINTSDFLQSDGDRPVAGSAVGQG